MADNMTAAERKELDDLRAYKAKNDASLKATIVIGNDRTTGKEYETLRFTGGTFAKGSGAPSHGVAVWQKLYDQAVIDLARKTFEPETLEQLRAAARIVKTELDAVNAAKQAEADKAKKQADEKKQAELNKAKADAKNA